MNKSKLLQALHLHFGPSHFSVKSLKFVKFTDDVILSGKLFHDICLENLYRNSRKLFTLIHNARVYVVSRSKLQSVSDII